MKGRNLLAAALGASLLVAPAPAGPQSPPAQGEGEEPAAVFLEKVEVEIVNLDVVVTDRRGNPIEGLTRDDFELEVDGEPTAIDNFYSVGLEKGEPGVPDEGAPREDAAFGVDAGPEQALHALILFDNVHATPGERVRAARDLAASFENGMQAGARAAVAYYDGGVKIAQPFTTDGAALAATIEEMAAAQIGFTSSIERRSILQELERASDDEGDMRSVLGTIENFAERQGAEVRQTLAALAAQVDALAGLPGRKVLLFVTSGLELRPGQDLLAAFRNKFGGSGLVSDLDLATGHVDLGLKLREVTRRANAGRVALYAIGTAGAGPTAAVSAEEGGFDFNALTAPGGGRTYDVTVDTVFRANLGSGLELMAAVTGGDALTGSGNYDLIAERVQQDAGFRYSLGFRAPEGSEPGASHKIDVKVPGQERVQLRYRRELVTASPAERGSERTLAALLWGHADNDIGVAADFGPVQPSDQGKDLYLLPVLVKVPFVNLVLLPEQRFHRGQITIFVVAEDEDGRLSPVQTVEAPIRIPTDRLVEALGGVGGYRVGLLLRPGPHRLAIGVRDEIGDVISTIRLEHDVVAPGAA